MTNDIKDCRKDFAEDIHFLKDILTGDGPLETKVEAAAILWDLSEQAKQALEPFKKMLRETAIEQGCQPGSSFKCYSHDKSVEASVVMASPRLSLKRGVDMEQLAGSASFGDYVEQTTTYKMRRGAELNLEDMAEDERDTWLDAVSFDTPTPRVSFTRKTIHTNQKEV